MNRIVLRRIFRIEFWAWTFELIELIFLVVLYLMCRFFAKRLVLSTPLVYRACNWNGLTIMRLWSFLGFLSHRKKPNRYSGNYSELVQLTSAALKELFDYFFFDYQQWTEDFNCYHYKKSIKTSFKLLGNIEFNYEIVNDTIFRTLLYTYNKTLFGKYKIL